MQELAETKDCHRASHDLMNKNARPQERGASLSPWAGAGGLTVSACQRVR